ncbi:hypothetical protein C4D60_Mb07t03810 [Musa balbisiana]|uniref:Uncharacterized protein n=1 Tax=Musa balbisiana TaxID=52838 RepID=A0A4S8JCY5_MUSBA|nr:hypothetical protein C4D60_Mb07t03810 [Musa balbisiana]
MATSDLILLLPYPSQGHINPMLQFGKRCAAHGASATLATTRFILNTTRPQPGPVHLAAISDGCDRAGYAEVSSIPGYLDRLERVGSETLESLLRSEAAAGRPVRLLVFDAFLPWAGDVGRRLGLATAAFFTQSCAVNALYFHVWEGRLHVPVQAAELDLPGLPRLRPRDLPSFLPDRDSIYPAYLQLVLNQSLGEGEKGQASSSLAVICTARLRQCSLKLQACSEMERGRRIENANKGSSL